MRTQLKINGELKDVEIKNGEITIIEPNAKSTGWERCNLEELYYTNLCDAIESYTEHGDIFGKGRYNSANYFSNKELAENIFRMQTLQRQMFRWQAKNDVPITFEDLDDEKWKIFYDIGNKTLKVSDVCFCVEGFIPYFSSRKVAEKCLEVFKDELTWLFTEFKWRMDT